MSRICLAVVVSFAVAVARADESPAGQPVAFRVENAVYEGDEKEPVSRSVTLFRDKVVWDFPARPAETPAAGKDAGGEIILHDPSRGRSVLVDPKRNVKTTIESQRLDRLASSLAAWARRSEDPVIRWAGGSDFAESLDETEHGLELTGPRVRYVVAHEAAPSREAANAYRQFADTAILLRSLIRPGGLPPFPRIAINERVAMKAAVPSEVMLEIDSKLKLPGLAGRLKSSHALHPRLLEADLARIEDAMARLAVAKEVPLSEYLADD